VARKFLFKGEEPGEWSGSTSKASTEFSPYFISSSIDSFADLTPENVVEAGILEDWK